jgi:predicted lipid-binding transport protein (Tim44 family)
MLGSRGMRSHSVPTRPAPSRPEPPPAEAPPAPTVAPRAPPQRPNLRAWAGPLAGVAAGWLIASTLSGAFSGEGRGLRFVQPLLLGAAFLVFLAIVRFRRAAQARPVWRTATPPVAEAPPAVASSLDEGLGDIRRLDPKFDPSRFTGYIEMVFRETYNARTRHDLTALRDRVTPELFGELQAQDDRTQSAGQSSHVEEIDVRAQVTEAWHEGGRDYLTAYITGTMLEYTVDPRTGGLVAGSKTVPGPVEGFWTFTRPAGLNPWMLSAIQTS